MAQSGQGTDYLAHLQVSRRLLSRFPNPKMWNRATSGKPEYSLLFSFDTNENEMISRVVLTQAFVLEGIER